MSELWYSRVTADITSLPDFIAYYENELNDAKQEIQIGGKLEKNLSTLPGITEVRFNQLQVIEAVLNYMNIQLRKIRRKHFQKYLESYARALTSRDAERYADGEDEVINYEVLVNEVALLRNQWLGILKALESKNFMLGHITRLRSVGMEDVVI